MAHFWTIKAFLPRMIDMGKGHIVTVASIAGMMGTSRLSDYCSSKFANVGMDESLRHELQVLGHGDKIKTTVVCPYYIDTGMFSGVRSSVSIERGIESLFLLPRKTRVMTFVVHPTFADPPDFEARGGGGLYAGGDLAGQDDGPHPLVL